MSGTIVHGGGVTEAAAQFGGQPQDWLDLSTGINPCPPPLPDVPASVWHRLPDRHLVDAAMQAAALYYGTGDHLPLPVPGTQSVIQLLPRLATPGRRIAIFGPTYGEYARCFTASGFAIDVIASKDEVSSDHGLVVLVNPNNPTGRTLTASAVEDLRRVVVGHGGMLVVDEAFGDQQPDLSVARDRPQMTGLIVFRSFGKFFGLAGLRLGFVIADATVTERFRDWLGPWAVSGPALFLATTQMTDGSAATIKAALVARKAALDRVLHQAGLTVSGGTGLFSLIEHDRALDLHTHLCRAQILTRRFDYEARWLRIGLAPDAAGDARLADALRTSGL
ncbi:threonine-phosphate decarboxylase CobD [Pararhizobium antarcticum]|uniref:threonine-phosphate decarboxylase n=1 Tax=Pararhizobium antarcticum TaxID=1798805 RepID=A0A657LVC1_9HYPH|nr:threonine-phosphate decarboxylase CobD [Pararhizobium antarcticum]OJF91919.1 threonine-phosphate decarboxylase [Rhizobium sp. 58]OJF98303.1 threonine-phosphate decarboxylase [Pararhizobium antarcticum]